MSIEEHFDEIYSRKDAEFDNLRSRITEWVTDKEAIQTMELNIIELTRYCAEHLNQRRNLNNDDIVYLATDVGLAVSEMYLKFIVAEVRALKYYTVKSDDEEYSVALFKDPDYDPTKPKTPTNREWTPLNGFVFSPITETEKVCFYLKHFAEWEKSDT